MFRFATAALAASCFASSLLAEGVPCEGATASKAFREFTTAIMQSVSGACAVNISQPACLALMRTMAEKGEKIDGLDGETIVAFDAWVEKHCPTDG